MFKFSKYQEDKARCNNLREMYRGELVKANKDHAAYSNSSQNKCSDARKVIKESKNVCQKVIAVSPIDFNQQCRLDVTMRE
jgi:collagenase-like PrtC family protease